MRPFQRSSIFGRLLGILACGGVGGIAAWSIVTLMGWDGTIGAIVATIIGMVVAMAAWVALTSLARMLSRAR
jgi:biopolymer transport protein ExbB/TolQ